MKEYILNIKNLHKGYRIAISLLTTQYALMIEYRAEIILWALSGVLPLIMLAIWSESDSFLVMYDDPKFLYKYFLSAFFVRQFTAVWVIFSFEEDNLEGRLSPFLLQPLNPFWRYYFSHIAEQFSRIPIVMVIFVILYIISPSLFWAPSFLSLLLGVICTFLAFSLRFLLHWLCSMVCFWTDRARSIDRLLLIPYVFLSGLVAPIDTFPPLIKSIALLTPFPYMLSFPSKIFAGFQDNISNGLLIMFLWSFIFYILIQYFWSKGLKRYSGMGS